MSLVAPKVDPDVLYDMIDIAGYQSWVKGCLKEFAELWNLCEIRDEQVFLREIIKRFVVLEGMLEAQAYANVAEKFGSLGLNPKSTWFVAAANSKEIDGSTAALQKLKNKITPYEIWHSRMLPNIPAASKLVKNGDTVVLFDDFIGTGGKLVTKGDWLLRNLADESVSDVGLIYFSVAGMGFGVENIRRDTGRMAFSGISLSKGISDFSEAEKVEEYKALMRRIESRLCDNYRNKKIEEYSLGFGESEALYFVLNDNCPNNVFPVFWWSLLKDGSRFNTLLQRAG
ncbi:hypothetical protein F6V05_29045 [Pseudomonas aeruginosa]|nr:hypothetical protein [Pseudomonas aeruginosa]